MTLPATDPLVVRMALEYRQKLISGERASIEALVRRWLLMERQLEDSFYSLASQIDQLRALEGTPSAAQIVRMQRYKELLQQVREQIAVYNRFAAEEIASGQARLIADGIVDARNILGSMYAVSGGVTGSFNVLPVSAVEYMVGFAGDGSPLFKLLQRDFEAAANGITDALIKAVGLGKSPRETAREMARGAGMGLNRALNIARTEQLRAYRESSRAAYAGSGVVVGYKRLSARDSRVCPACLFSDGMVYRTEDAFEAHVNCRCTLVPIVSGMPVIEWQDGKTWFMAQPEATQKSIMGSGRYESWKDGAFVLEDVVKRVENDTWGAALVPATLAELLGQ